MQTQNNLAQHVNNPEVVTEGGKALGAGVAVMQ